MSRKRPRGETTEKPAEDRLADTNQPTAAALRPKSRGLALKALVVLLIAAAGAAGIMWWQDQDLRSAKAALQANDAERALVLVDKYLARNPDSPSALALRARTLVTLNEDPAEAVRLFDRVGVANTEEMQAYAQAQIMLEQWSTALQYLLEVLKVRPNDPTVLHATATCQLRLGLQSSAVETATLASKCEGREAQGYLLLGTILREIKLPRDAAKAYEEVLFYEPDAANLPLTPAEFLRQYGRLLLEIEEPARAGPQLARSAQLEPKADAFAGLGEAYVLVGKLPEAIAAWRQAIELDPLNDDARVGLAAVALRAKEPRQALEWLKPLETQGRGMSHTAVVLAAAYEGVKDEASAKRWKDIAAEITLREQHADELSRILIEEPETDWAQALRAHQFATAGNWGQAQDMLGSLPTKATGDLKRYVADLVVAIEKKQTPPPIEQSPIPLPKPKPTASPTP